MTHTMDTFTFTYNPFSLERVDFSGSFFSLGYKATV